MHIPAKVARTTVFAINMSVISTPVQSGVLVSSKHLSNNLAS